MSAQKITNLGAPTDAADAVTKEYVDNLASAGGGTGGVAVPSWDALKSEEWGTPHAGISWEVYNESNKVSGIAICLSTQIKSGNNPSATSYGSNCWCRVSSINNIVAAGAWVFEEDLGTSDQCRLLCPFYCPTCIRSTQGHGACTRAELLSAP
jgi:hypothetical protein